MINLLETVFHKTQKELVYNEKGTSLKAKYTYGEGTKLKALVLIYHTKKEGYKLRVKTLNKKNEVLVPIEMKAKKFYDLVFRFQQQFGGCPLKFLSCINQNQNQNQNQDFGDYQEAKEQAKQDHYEGTLEDFKEDYISLEITIEEEPLNYSLSNQIYKTLYSEKGLDTDLLEEIQGLDICSKYDDQTYLTTFHKKQCTNYKIRYVLKLSRPLYSVELDHFNNEFSLKG